MWCIDRYLFISSIFLSYVAAVWLIYGYCTAYLSYLADLADVDVHLKQMSSKLAPNWISNKKAVEMYEMKTKLSKLYHI